MCNCMATEISVFSLYHVLYSTVYDVKIESLPLADLSESTTPIWCDACQKKGERKKLNLTVLNVENVSVPNIYRYSIFIDA